MEMKVIGVLTRFARPALRSIGLCICLITVSAYATRGQLALAASSPDARAIQTPRAGIDAKSNAACDSSGIDRKFPPVKITESLILSIPARYIRHLSLHCLPSSDASPYKKSAESAWVDFDFFLPDFSGYTNQRRRQAFDVDEVQVAYVMSAKEIEINSRQPAHYPANQLKNLLRMVANPNKYRDMYGMRCYEAQILKNRVYCYSARAGKSHKGILFTVEVPPYSRGVVNPQMWTNYFSPLYGGIEIAWRTNVKNMPRWRDIDDQIWRFLAAWNAVHAN